jgi:cytoskeleton protein RodZ
MPDQVDWRAAEREATPGRAVGRLLRDQREALGLSVVDIEKRLRLRRNHVEAIEAGRFDLLPGAAYIPAFLRTYAGHLGLDPEKVLSAYHSSGPVPIKRPVALPADFPIVEKRAPIGLAVLTVLLVIGAGYAVWHYLPRQQSVVAEKVPPVPDRLLATMPAANVPAATTAAEPTKQAAQPPQTLPNGLPVETWPAPRQDSSSAAAPQAAPQPAPPPIVVAVPAPPPPVVMSAPSIGQAQAAQPAADVQEARTVQPEPAAPVPAPPQVSLPMRIDTPLLVRSNSWIELRAPNGDILAMTYVRAGESYTVPAGISYRVIDAR